MQQEIEANRSTMATNELLTIERMRSDAWHNEASALRNAWLEGYAEARTEVARTMLRHNRPIDEIMEVTELARDEIETLLVA